MLQQAHEQSALLARLEMELMRSREYISKVYSHLLCLSVHSLTLTHTHSLTQAVKNREEPWGSQPAEEEMIFPGGHGTPGAWMDDGMFA